MVMIGTDSHKRTHTVVALDDVGRRLATKTVRANAEGHLALLTLAAQFDGVDDTGVVFALEDCRHLTRRLEADLLTAGRRVVRVPTRLMANARRGNREPGKSDPIDAEAVALAALRHPDLPVAELEGPAREVKLLSDHRRDLVVQRTRVAAQIRWHLHELDPDLVVPRRGLVRRCVVERVNELDRIDGVVARLARRLLARCQQLNAEINALERELRDLVQALAPTLLAIPGCGSCRRPSSSARPPACIDSATNNAYARFTGTAPVPVWSGSSKGKVRLNRGGNRTVNCALHMIAVTQTRGVGPGRAYVDKQLERGKDRVAALRLLRRRLSDVVFTALRTDEGAAPERPAVTTQTDRLAA